ncbi:hypothetical protein CVT25_008631 [Psilocybe cyanescens]|uniref:Uncharacterized protein n=1 Tax=Psilocybe cyanescens TaxID=93625 RepID=A0A409XDB7_PSICY|nr:hypothetical protein CVT25_008631 [Psilocybe cyanescens]
MHEFDEHGLTTAQRTRMLEVMITRLRRARDTLEGGTDSEIYGSLYQPTRSTLYSNRPPIRLETTPMPANIGELDMIMSCAQRGHPENERRLAIRMLNILFEEAAALPAHKAKTEVQWHLINYWRVPSPGLSTSLRPLVAYTDASQHGIGLFITSIEQPFAWTWVRNHPSIPYGQTGEIVTSWAELIAVELSVHTLLLHRAYARASKHFIILSDNTGVVDALCRGYWTADFGLHDVVQRIQRRCAAHGITLDVRWIPSIQNTADSYSKGRYDAPDDVMGMIDWWQWVKLYFRDEARISVEEVPRHLNGLVLRASVLKYDENYDDLTLTEKLKELWVIPISFIIVTGTSMVVGWVLGWWFGLSLIVSATDLAWGSDDNKNAMLERTLTYLMMSSMLGMEICGLFCFVSFSLYPTPLVYIPSFFPVPIPIPIPIPILANVHRSSTGMAQPSSRGQTPSLNHPPTSHPQPRRRPPSSDSR